jgi:hypothetical protein
MDLMGRPPVRQNPTDNAAQDKRALETVSDLKDLLQAPFLKGRSITFGTTGAGTKAVAHGLGRKPAGWFTTDIAGPVASLSRDSWDDRQIVFFVTGASTFTVWVW